VGKIVAVGGGWEKKGVEMEREGRTVGEIESAVLEDRPWVS